MKFVINSDELSKIVQGLAKTVNGKSSLAILDHYLFEVNGNMLYVTASDSENLMKASVSLLESSLPEGDETRFCIHSSMIGDFLKNIPIQPISFDVNMNDFEVKISYQNGHIKFPCTAGSEYPVINLMKDEFETISIKSSMMLDDINRTCHFVGQETLRPVMNSICFNFTPNNLDVVSSNGNVLVKISHEVESDFANCFLLPSKPASLLKYFLDKDDKDVTIHFASNAAVFMCENWILTCRLIEGKYPNYNSVIPQSENVEVKIDKKNLQETIRRMLPMGNQAMKTIKIDVKESILTISCEDVDFNKSAEETILCEKTGVDLTIGVNGEVFNALLSQISSDNVRLKMTERSRPVIAIPEENNNEETFISLLMPTLISN